MTLSIIEMRLKVFPQYLEYRIRHRIELEKATNKLDILYYSRSLVTFNDWLYYNNYSNLIL